MAERRVQSQKQRRWKGKKKNREQKDLPSTEAIIPGSKKKKSTEAIMFFFFFLNGWEMGIHYTKRNVGGILFAEVLILCSYYYSWNKMGTRKSKRDKHKPYFWFFILFCFF